MKQQLVFTKPLPVLYACVHECVCVCVLMVQGGPVNAASLMTRKFVSIQEPFKPIIIWTSVINPRFMVRLGLDMLTNSYKKQKPFEGTVKLKDSLRRLLVRQKLKA